jgi:hypothetical protein
LKYVLESIGFVPMNTRVSVQANAPKARYAGAKTGINELLRSD